MKKLSVILVSLFLVAATVTGCGGRGSAAENNAPAPAPAASGEAAPSTAEPAAADAQYTIRLGHVLATEHPYTEGGQKFAELVAEKTNGAVKVDVFANSQLGNERDMIEGLQLGTLEMCIVSTAPLSGFTNDFLVFDLPYVFTDTATARGCVDSEIGQGMLDSLDSVGIKGLCYFENGFRNVTNSKGPVEHPADLQGVKIRTMENPIQMATFKAMGADPTPMAFGELYTALQQKTIDAQENPLAIIDTSKFYEVQPYLSMTEHFYAPAPLLIAKSYFENLPPEYQTAVLEAANEARDYERGLLDEMNSRLLGEMSEKYGMAVNEVDKQEFRAAVQPVYDEYTGDGQGQVPAALLEKVAAFKVG